MGVDLMPGKVRAVLPVDPFYVVTSAYNPQKMHINARHLPEPRAGYVCSNKVNAANFNIPSNQQLAALPVCEACEKGLEAAEAAANAPPGPLSEEETPEGGEGVSNAPQPRERRADHPLKSSWTQRLRGTIVYFGECGCGQQYKEYKRLDVMKTHHSHVKAVCG